MVVRRHLRSRHLILRLLHFLRCLHRPSPRLPGVMHLSSPQSFLPSLMAYRVLLQLRLAKVFAPEHHQSYVSWACSVSTRPRAHHDAAARMRWRQASQQSILGDACLTRRHCQKLTSPMIYTEAKVCKIHPHVSKLSTWPRPEGAPVAAAPLQRSSKSGNYLEGTGLFLTSEGLGNVSDKTYRGRSTTLIVDGERRNSIQYLKVLPS